MEQAGPVEQADDLIVCRLLLARLRREGQSFDEAWATALAVLPPIKGQGQVAKHREWTLDALACTSGHWRSAFEGKPPPKIANPTPRRWWATLLGEDD